MSTYSTMPACMVLFSLCRDGLRYNATGVVKMALLRCPASSLPTVRLRHLPPVWGARYLPCRRCGFVSYRPRHTLLLRFICHRQRGATRPRPLARGAASATGGASLAPPCVYLFHHAGVWISYHFFPSPSSKQISIYCCVKLKIFAPVVQKNAKSFRKT